LDSVEHRSDEMTVLVKKYVRRMVVGALLALVVSVLGAACSCASVQGFGQIENAKPCSKTITSNEIVERILKM
jgi:hypothetical protein